MSHFTPSQLLLSHREIQAIRAAVNDSITDDPRFVHLSPVQKSKHRIIFEPAFASAFRAALRVYLGTSYGLKAVQILLARLTARRPGSGRSRKPLVASPNRMGLSLGLMLFLHRMLYVLFSRNRRTLLSESSAPLRQRYPLLWSALSSPLAPAVGASLSGLALGICPTDALRVTITIYVLVRAGELSYKTAELAGYLRKKPRWLGSWVLFALGQGQMLHAFLFDPDCFPTTYGDFILDNTPEYIQRRPAVLSSAVKWPTRREIVDSIAEMARLKWPTYISPILRPKDATTLPVSINPVISPITSRAHPALQYLSCALIHPSETSCFTPFLRQLLSSFQSVGRTLALYYGVLSLVRIRKLITDPLAFLTHLSVQILRTTIVVTGGIGGAWGSICFFNNYLPGRFIPRFRFFIGGALAGCIALVDRSATGHANNMYVLRNSIDSLWKVGKKHRWWRSVKGGDVYVFVLSLAAINILYDIQRETFASDPGPAAMIKVLRGDIEIGLKNKTTKEQI